MIVKEIMEKNGFGDKAVIFGLWRKIAEEVERLPDECISENRLVVTNEPVKAIVEGISKNLIRYAGLVVDELDKQNSTDKYELELLNFFVKKAYEGLKRGDYGKFAWSLSNIDEMVAERIELGIYEKRAETDAEMEYIEKVADSMFDEKFKLEVSDNGIVRIGKFRKAFDNAEAALDFIRNYWREIGYSDEEIVNKLVTIDVSKFNKKTGVEIDLEKSVLVLAEELSKEIDKDTVAEIMENTADKEIYKSGIELMKKKFGIDGRDEELGVMFNLYKECRRRAGKDVTERVFSKVFGKKYKTGAETYLSNEDEGTIAVVDDTGRVRIKEKDTGAERGEEVYKSKEEAIASLGAKGYK
jgi:hypothetical protein